MPTPRASTVRDVLAALREGRAIEVPSAIVRRHRKRIYAAWWEYGGCMVIVHE